MSLTIAGVTQKYGAMIALSDVRFSVNPGEVVGLLGPNGAGKTTLMNLICGRLAIQTGTISIGGFAPGTHEARKVLGMIPQDVHFPEHLKVSEVIRYVGTCHKDPIPDEELIEEFQLQKFYNQYGNALSGGEKRRLGFALAFMGRPQWVLLDEPTTGMDIASRDLFWQKTKQFRDQGGGVLLTTHYLQEAESLSDRVIILKKGTIPRQGTVEEIRSEFDVSYIQFSSTSLNDALESEFQKNGNEFSVWTRHPEEVIRKLVELNVPFQNLEVRKASLEESFKNLIESSP